MIYVANIESVDMSNRTYVDLVFKSPEDDTVFPTEGAMQKHREFIKDLVRLGVLSSERLLDYGCGYGGFLKTAKVMGFQGVGIEPCRYRANWAREKWGLEVVNKFGEEIDFHSLGTIGFIYSSQVFEHLKDPLYIAQKLYEVLESGGHIWVDVPNHNHRFLGMEIMDQSHFNYFTLHSLARLLSQTGFHIVRKQHVCRPPLGGDTAKYIAKRILGIFNLGVCNVLARK
jgi:SAM-dependent methyltransferase